MDKIIGDIAEMPDFFKSVLDSVDLPILILNSDMEIVYLNLAYSDFVGEDRDKILGKNIAEIFPDFENTDSFRAFKEVMKTGESKKVEGKYGDRYLKANIFKISMGILAISEDITTRKILEQNLREQREIFSQMAHYIDQVVFIYSIKEEKVLFVNNAFEEVFGISLDKVYHDPLGMLTMVHPDDLERLKKEFSVENINQIKKSKEIEYRLITESGDLKWISAYLYPVRDDNSNLVRVISISEDITDRKEAQKDLKKFKTVSDNINYGLVIMNMDGDIKYLNSYFARKHDYEIDKAMNKNFHEFLDREHRDYFDKLKEGLAEGRKFSSEEIWHRRKDGSVFPMLMDALRIKDEKTDSEYIAISSLDITISLTDDLTGVFNRRFAFKILPKLLKRADREEEVLSICFIDIDNLKKINDNYGHRVGDRALKLIADAFSRNIRGSDFLCRMGGDEFLIIFPKLKKKESHRVVDRVWKEIRKREKEFKIDFSYGFSEYKPETEASIDELIRYADDMMYEMKLSKR